MYVQGTGRRAYNVVLSEMVVSDLFCESCVHFENRELDESKHRRW